MNRRQRRISVPNFTSSSLGGVEPDAVSDSEYERPLRGGAMLLARLMNRAAAAALPELRRSHQTIGDALDEHLSCLSDAVRNAALGESVALATLRTAVPPRTMLRALRCAILTIAEETPDVTDLATTVAAMRGLERVEAQLDSDPVHQFADGMSGARGLDMVVEVAHDMRSPLTSILFLVETLRSSQSGTINRVQEHQLGLVYGAAFGLSAMASDLIELARGGAQLVDGAPVPFSVKELLHSIRDIVLPISAVKGLEVRIVCPERDARIGHPAALSRVLLNLLSNALKYTDGGWTEIACRQLSLTRVEFTVRDTGPGLPPHVLQSLFTPFRSHPQLSGHTFSNAGLGLAICRTLVQALNSELHVETAEQQGTRFSFELELPIASRL